MRLLYLVNIPRFFVTHRLPLALAARDAGYEVHIAASMHDDEYHNENIARIHAEGLDFHPLPLHQHSLRPRDEAAAMRAILRLYRDLQPDLAHHVAIKAVIYGGFAARRARTSAVVHALSGLGYVFTSQSAKARLLRPALQPALRLALGQSNARTIFQNPDDQAAFIQRKLVDPARSVLIRGSGVDMQRFRVEPEPDDDPPMILFAGRLLWPKGLGLFAEAARQLQGRARFVVAGIAEENNPAAVPLATLESWQRAGLIEYWGQRHDMPAVFAQANIVCLPSTYGEGVPKVLIEAAACGRAIVSTDTPGCREIVHDGENGLLVAPNDLIALCAALQKLIDDPALRQRMGESGRSLAEAEFSLTRVNQATLALYATLLASKYPAQR